MSENIDNRDDWRHWNISYILSVETGKLLCGIEGLYMFLNWMTDDILYTHQLPKAVDVCKPFLEGKIDWLKEECMDLKDCVGVEINPDNYLSVLRHLAAKHGEYIEVPRLPKGAWHSGNPLAELFEMMNGKKETE